MRPEQTRRPVQPNGGQVLACALDLYLCALERNSGSKDKMEEEAEE